MSTRISGDLLVKSNIPLRSGSVALRKLNLTHKKVLIIEISMKIFGRMANWKSKVPNLVHGFYLKMLVCMRKRVQFH